MEESIPFRFLSLSLESQTLHILRSDVTYLINHKREGKESKKKRMGKRTI